MALTEASKKFWQPDDKLVNYLVTRQIHESDKVLEIGPGTVPFKRADSYVDFVDVAGLDPAKQFLKIDAATGKLPFDDKTFDFIYCRHVLEDSWNPFLLCEEMSRVGKAGYIETPSPMAEIARGVDGTSPPYRGYHHHRWIIWNCRSELRIVTKYAIIEYLQFDEANVDDMLKTGRLWNTHLIWRDRINYVHRQSPLDYSIPRDYALMLTDAMTASKASTEEVYYPINQA